MFVLFDSRDRVRTDKRIAYLFPLSFEGLQAAWKLTVDAECPAEWDDYKGLASDYPDWQDACVVFNDYWSYYGWHLGEYKDEFVMPDDCLPVVHKS